MKLQITTSKTEEIDVPVPSFWQSPNGDDIRGIFSENDFREVLSIQDSIFLRSTGIDTETVKSAILTAVQYWQPISELDFLTKWDDILNQLSLTPKLQP